MRARLRRALTNRVRRISAILLAAQLVGFVATLGGSLLLLNRTVFEEPVTFDPVPMVYVSVDGLDQDSHLWIGVGQSSRTGQNTTVTFSFASDRQLAVGSEIDVQIAIVGSKGQLGQVRCLNRDLSETTVERVPYTDLRRGTQRLAELGFGDKRLTGQDIWTVDDSTARARDLAWERKDILKFDTRVKYDTLNLSSPMVSTEDSLEDITSTPWIARSGLTGRFACEVSSQGMWKVQSSGALAVYAPLQVGTVPQNGGSFLGRYEPTTLEVENVIARDRSYVPTTKPDGVKQFVPSFQFKPTVGKSSTGNAAPSDYFVFEKVGRASNLAQYSFWLGLLVSFTLTFFTAIVRNIFRMWSGRVALYDE